MSRVLIGGINTSYLRFKWLYLPRPSLPNPKNTVHLLVVKNPIYSQIAQVCVESFLYYHENSRIILHCDQSTQISLSKAMKRVARKGKVEVVLDQNSTLTWQEQKIDLIVSLSGSHDIFIDADLLWNGQMPIRKGVCFFVEEFIFTSNPLYKELFSQLELKNQLVNSMKNTSFFSWGGEKINLAKKADLLGFLSGFEKQFSSLKLPEDKKLEISRIVEQLGLSMMFERGNCSFLKEKDSQLDGSFVESSYYGATGTKFGKFGITSRKF